MPKNMGKTIKQFHYLPLLDDANMFDQGLNAAGVAGDFDRTIVITPPNLVGNALVRSPHNLEYVVGTDAVAATALTKAQALAFNLLKFKYGIAGADYAAVKTAAITAGFLVDDTIPAIPAAGNLYGSSKDPGVINARLPILGETGGRVNKVGFKRIEIEGTIRKFGFFHEYSQESLDFDNDDMLEEHLTRETLNAANEINEDLIQMDLLLGAGVRRFGGTAVSLATVTGEGTVSMVSYAGLSRLSVELDLNRCPKSTKMITGSTMNDTKTVPAARFIHIGPELVPTLRELADTFGQPAFIPVEKYGAAITPVDGEVGAIADFRVVVVEEMMNYAGAGATATTGGAVYRNTNGKYDVFPMLVVGSEAFTTIGFQTDGKQVKFTLTHKKPGIETADRVNDPYGEMGFMSIKWYYGSMILRPERIAVFFTACKW
jgi:N4-gp56 family major capsid protein